MIRRIFWVSIFTLLASMCFAQEDGPDAEEIHLREVLSEAGRSPIEFIRAIESHLAKFPETPRRPDFERALVKAAIEVKDDDRTLLYGQRVLATDPSDIDLLERVTRILLSKDDKTRAESALKYARQYEEEVKALEEEKPSGPVAQGEWREEIDRRLGRALVFQARANGNLGNLDEAVALAQRSYATYPTAESAREIGLLLAKMGKEEEAIPHLADAFTIADSRNTDAGRAKDRKRMGELYRKLHGSEAGLGDLVLEAYDRTSALLARRSMARRRLDPNSGVSAPMEYTLSGLNGDSVKLSSLRGKVVVFDFWATWCGPCRMQHPLYEEVKRKFEDRSDVVFLSVSTDEDRGAVEPFLREHRWTKNVYFEDGLSKALRISSIPTTIVADKRGEVVSRLTGFIPDRFVDMLSQRIQEALRN
jgi:thiol-disulfide isomerase/thioredoxin